MYLWLKLIQVPWSIKTMLDLCLLVCLTFISATFLFLAHSNKTKRKPAKQNNRWKKSIISNGAYIWTFTLFYCGFCISNQHLQGNGAPNSITWYEKFSQETTKACSFILFPFSFFLLSMFHCSTKVSLSPSKRTVVRTPLSLWTMWHWLNLCWRLCNFPRCLCWIH